MTDFTDEQLERIAVAMTEAAQGNGGELAVISIAEVLTKLRPQKFAEGQVVCSPSKAVSADTDYFKYEKLDWNCDIRHLTLTELGPAVRELRDAAKKTTREALLYDNWWKDLDDALTRFDEVHHGGRN